MLLSVLYTVFKDQKPTYNNNIIYYYNTVFFIIIFNKKFIYSYSLCVILQNYRLLIVSIGTLLGGYECTIIIIILVLIFKIAY